MNIMNQNNMKQGVLRVGVCLLMLSGTFSLSAQTEAEKTNKDKDLFMHSKDIYAVYYSDGKSFLSMGGNTGIYYGIK